VLLTRYYWGDPIEKNVMDGTCSRYGEEERSKQSFDEKAEGKRPLGRRRRRWEVNIKMDLQEVRW
jgi:hypothetical protein